MAEININLNEYTAKLSTINNGFAITPIPHFDDLKGDLSSAVECLNIMNEMLDVMDTYHVFLRSDVEKFVKVAEIIHDTDVKLSQY